MFILLYARYHKTRSIKDQEEALPQAHTQCIQLFYGYYTSRVIAGTPRYEVQDSV